MNVLQFVASIVGSLAWPATLLLAFLLLRKPLRNLLPLLQKLKYKDLELEFSRRVEEVRAEVLELPAAVSQTPASDAGESESLARLAEISPRAAVLEAWRLVESAAIEAARTTATASTPLRDKTLTFHAIRSLENNPALDRGAVGLLRELRSLRNEAAHAPDFALSKASALEYGASCALVITLLRAHSDRLK